MNGEASEDRPILKVVPGGDASSGRDQSIEEPNLVKRWQSYVVILLSVILVLVTSHMTGPDQKGTAKNLLTFEKSEHQQ